MMMNESMSTMLPHQHFDMPCIYDPPQPPPIKRFPIKIPKVVRNQKAKFESDELFKKLSRESEIRFTGYSKDQPVDARKQKFLSQVREGWTEIAFTNSGTNLQLSFSPQGGYASDIDFSKEAGKVHIKSPFIMNGVCVRCRGSIDLDRLDGVGCLEFDDENARVEDALYNEHYEQWQNKIRELSQRKNSFNNYKAFFPQYPNIKVE